MASLTTAHFVLFLCCTDNVTEYLLKREASVLEIQDFLQSTSALYVQIICEMHYQLLPTLTVICGRYAACLANESLMSFRAKFLLMLILAFKFDENL